jgi:imidazolonepropionase-like amidohydrolase
MISSTITSRSLVLAVTASLLVLISCGTSQSDSSNSTVLKGATLFDGNGAEPIENSIIVVKDGKIDCAGASTDCAQPTTAEVIDVSGKFITPGLIDAHVHFFQTAFFDSRPDALDLRDTYPFPQVAAYQKKHPQRYYDSYLCSGITGVYDVGGFTWSLDFQDEAEQNPQAPHVAAAGPLITPATLDIFNTPSDKVLVNLDSKETGNRMVEYLAGLESTGVKLWQLRPDDQEYMDNVEAVSEAAAKHDKSLIVHATSLNQAKAAVGQGAELLVHSVSDQEVDEAFISQAKEQGTIYTPTLIVGSGYMMAYRAAAGVSEYPLDDPNSCVDSKTRNLFTNASQFSDHQAFSDQFVQRLQDFNPQEDRVSEIAMKNLKKVYEAGIPIAVGTDAGNPGTVHGPSIYEEMEAMQRAGIPTEDLIVMATRNGAKAMQRGDDFGTLESGKMANLIILEENPAVDIANMRTIEQTMIKGQFIDIEQLSNQ